MESFAVISDCGHYRYRLGRTWGVGDHIAFIMLNPSTADAIADDATIRRCIGFGQRAGYQGLLVGNLFAWRATKPSELRAAGDPVGPSNDAALIEIISDSRLIVCAWGTNVFGGRDLMVLDMIRSRGRVPHCLRLTMNGHPGHPLYVPAAMRPIPF